MKRYIVLFMIMIFSCAAIAQEPRPTNLGTDSMSNIAFVRLAFQRYESQMRELRRQDSVVDYHLNRLMQDSLPMSDSVAVLTRQLGMITINRMRYRHQLMVLITPYLTPTESRRMIRLIREMENWNRMGR